MGLERFVSEIKHKFAVNSFLNSKNLFKLVSEGRIPTKVGYIGLGLNEEMNPEYVVPPRGFDPKEIDTGYMDLGGRYMFLYKDGVRRTAENYVLTKEQEILLKTRLSFLQRWFKL